MADALCGPSNPLQTFQKHATADRSLQRDRLTHQLPPHQDFRSPSQTQGSLDAEFHAFKAPTPLLPNAPPLPQEPLHYPAPPAPLAGPSVPGWAVDFNTLSLKDRQPLNSPPSVHLQPSSQTLQNRPTLPSWADDFRAQEVSLLAAQQPAPLHAAHSPWQPSFPHFTGIGHMPYAGPAFAQSQRQSNASTDMAESARFDAAFARLDADQARVQPDFKGKGPASAPPATADGPGVAAELPKFDLAHADLTTDTLPSAPDAEADFAAPATRTTSAPWPHIELDPNEDQGETGLRLPGDGGVKMPRNSLPEVGTEGWATLRRGMGRRGRYKRWMDEEERRHAEALAEPAERPLTEAEININGDERRWKTWIAEQERLHEEAQAAQAQRPDADAALAGSAAGEATSTATEPPAEQVLPQVQEAQPTAGLAAPIGADTIPPATASAAVDAGAEADALARTAGEVLARLRDERGEKFQNSKFMGLMQQFRDGEVAIEGERVVPSGAAAAGAEARPASHPGGAGYPSDAFAPPASEGRVQVSPG